ncbi:MAG: hypothetical protein IT267_04485 [Saprospiraceae bacterium]|nr:hypothetical protein [Saprospiraceae bacterium]
MIYSIVPNPLKNNSIFIQLPASKSQSNRALIIQALSEEKPIIQNLSQAEDSLILEKILKGKAHLINVGHAGTTLRFLCAYLCIHKGEFILNGSDRLKQRPIQDLVEALKALKAEVLYLEKDKFIPIKIIGNPRLKGGEIELNASLSSQFLSSLLMIAPCLTEGLKIKILDKLASPAFVELTVNMMQSQGVKCEVSENTYYVKKQKYNNATINIESDYTSVSYWFSVLAIIPSDVEFVFDNITQPSTQPDSIVVKIFEEIGISSNFKNNKLFIRKTSNFSKPKKLKFNLESCPDLTQSIMCTCAALNIELELNGLYTLPFKESDRLSSMKIELAKFAIHVEIIDQNTIIQTGEFVKNTNAIIETYSDHRMALSFAPLLFINGYININHPDVVKKSYPEFWKEFSKISKIVEVKH